MGDLKGDRWSAPFRNGFAEPASQRKPEESPMPAFRAEVPHGLGQEEATKRLKGFMDQVTKRFEDDISAVDGVWTDHVLSFSLSTNGLTIKGALTVEEDKARVEGNLPLLASPFKGMIEKSIAGELSQALA